jgi:hypothetical protein
LKHVALVSERFNFYEAAPMLKERRSLYDPMLMIMVVPLVIACEIEAGLGGM